MIESLLLPASEKELRGASISIESIIPNLSEWRVLNAIFTYLLNLLHASQEWCIQRKSNGSCTACLQNKTLLLINNLQPFFCLKLQFLSILVD